MTVITDANESRLVRSHEYHLVLHVATSPAFKLTGPSCIAPPSPMVPSVFRSSEPSVSFNCHSCPPVLGSLQLSRPTAPGTITGSV